MKNWKETLVQPDTPIREAIAVIDRSATQICLVVDNNLTLLGTITDGDVRRGLLQGIDLTEPVSTIMHRKPSTASTDDSNEFLLQLMDAKQIQQMPIVDADGVVVGLQLRAGLDVVQHRDNPVVLMAGGLGSRLRPLTNDTPKPLLQIGSRPIIETIINGFIEKGFRRIIISLNYQAHKIRDHLADGSHLGVQIEYIEEDVPLGTAGALSLLPSLPDLPVFVMNGDILTRVNYDQLLSFHQQSDAKATMCLRNYSQQVPFGVVTTNGHYISDIVEKPVYRHHVNAGIYVIEAEVIRNLPHNQFLDMPDLLMQLHKQGHNIAAFPIREYWIDIGQMQDYHRANQEFDDNF